MKSIWKIHIQNIYQRFVCFDFLQKCFSKPIFFEEFVCERKFCCIYKTSKTAVCMCIKINEILTNFFHLQKQNEFCAIGLFNQKVCACALFFLGKWQTNRFWFGFSVCIDNWITKDFIRAHFSYTCAYRIKEIFEYFK